MNPSLHVIARQARGSHHLKISQHAYLRARERLHWTQDTILRMANRALAVGLAPGNATGSLKYCLLSKTNFGVLSCPFLYGENIYVFAYDSALDEVVLLTVYRAERTLLRVLTNKTQRHCNRMHFGVN